MANKYTQIYLHIIFATKNRFNAIPPFWEEKLHKYIGGIISNHGHTPIQIGGTASHIHILLGYNVNQLLPDLVKEIKTSSARFANQNRMLKCKFGWQRGYACVSYSKSHKEDVVRYIMNQHLHHNGMTLEDEVRKLMDKFGIEYDPRFIIREEE